MTFDDVRDIPELKSVVRPRSAVEDILERGRVFYRDDASKQGLTGLPLALQDALAYAGPNGFVATMPELIAAKVAVAVPTGDSNVPYDRSHWLWEHWYAAYSEEHVGPNYDRRFYPKEDYVVVVVHGGGLLTPERILRAYPEGLVDGAARYAPEEFRGLLRGQLPGGELPLFSFEDALTQTLPRRCGIVLPYRRASATDDGFLSKEEFLQHPLVIARNAGVQHLDEYFDRVSWNGMLGCTHPFARIDPSIMQGRVLFLCNFHYGLHGGDNLSYDGRFVGVAPEARR